MNSLFLELSKQRSLLKMMEEKGFMLCQQNGQRTYGGPPPNWGSRPPPSRDCEVFIGRLPRMCFEDELIPLFLTAGELYEFRLMLDFSGTNRGYGYAHYATLAGAERAIAKLNKYEIRPGHQIGVLKSKNNCRLLFGNIKTAMNVDAFNEFIRTATDQVLSVFMFKNFQNLKQTDFRISAEVEEAFLSRVPRNTGNNQFAIVEYENHKAAAVARRVLIPKYGHILAIDWAVPPREKKRFNTAVDSSFQPMEQPLLNDSNFLSTGKSFSKIRPVPTLLVQPSLLDDAPFMPKNFKDVIKFFKYQLSVCLYKSVELLEIPLFICKEIERKIVDRVTNLENCSQAVQLIFNYFSWYNERKRFGVSSEVQKLLQEVKMYADSFVHFIQKKLKFGPTAISSEDNYYMHVLPLKLNILFRMILRSDREYQFKLSEGITKGLEWLADLMQKGDKASKDLIEEIFSQIKNEDGPCLDKVTTLAKALFLNAMLSQKQPQDIMAAELRVNSQKYGNQHSPEMERTEAIKNGGPVNQKLFPEDQQPFRVDDNRCMPFSGFGKLNEPIVDVYPPVPLLLVQPSIMNKVPFMPEMFNNVITYFKHLIRVCLSLSAWQLNIPHNICNEIEGKIIDRISNVENCSEGVQLILIYFSLWIEKRPSNVNPEIQTVLNEVKTYSDAFVSFIWTKTMSVYAPNETVENYFCNVLPLRLNLLFQMMLIFNTDSSVRFFIGISKGLTWLEGFCRKEDKSAKEFLEEMTRFILDVNLEAYEKAKYLGKVFCVEMMTSSGHPINQYATLYPSLGNAKSTDQVSNSSSIATLNGLPFSGSDIASVCTVNCSS